MPPKETNVPGRQPLNAFAKSCAGLTKEQYEAAHPHPLLVQLTERAMGDGNPNASGFATIVPDAAPAISRKEANHVFEVAKRAGANAFEHMITLGRTRNNDIVVEDLSVSKFHASFRKDASGGWAITDTSKNGIQVDGFKVPHEKATPIRSGARIQIAAAVAMVFWLPGDAFEQMQKVKI
jgi:FHA domain